MEEKYGKFINIIKEVRINVPLVDVLAGMRNYDKFLKELVSNKNKLEELSVGFLNEECSAIIQNKIPPKLGDPRSFLISCTLGKAITCNALADLGASINLMPYSLYAKLSGGVAENMLVQVREFIFPVDFVILEMEEDSKVPLILGRPFLHTVDAIIRVKDPPTDLEMKPLPDHLEYAYLEKDSLLPVITAFNLKADEKERLDSVLKNHKEVFT
ncbi:reverse transcriptase domain-containing protein [Tanacetum coccineum]